MIEQNLNVVREKIQKARERSADRQEVTLVAVSKTKPVILMQEAYDQGVRDFGENRVQELCDKYDKMPSDVRWHLIGHLQHNKVKYIVDKVYLIHSVDSLDLAREIEKQAAKKDVIVNILIQVNISHEETKFGVDRNEVIGMIRTISTFPHVRIKGLMTIAPYTEEPETTRPVFRELKNLSIDIAALNIDNISICMLSMGMSGDYEVAVEEGATIVRIGTGIFGVRDYRDQYQCGHTAGLRMTQKQDI